MDQVFLLLLFVQFQNTVLRHVIKFVKAASWSGKARKKILVFYALLSPMMEIRRDSISFQVQKVELCIHTFINLLQPSCICNAKLF